VTFSHPMPTCRFCGAPMVEHEAIRPGALYILHCPACGARHRYAYNAMPSAPGWNKLYVERHPGNHELGGMDFDEWMEYLRAKREGAMVPTVHLAPLTQAEHATIRERSRTDRRAIQYRGQRAQLALGI
jgi:hypothetical protein